MIRLRKISCVCLLIIAWVFGGLATALFCVEALAVVYQLTFGEAGDAAIAVLIFMYIIVPIASVAFGAHFLREWLVSFEKGTTES